MLEELLMRGYHWGTRWKMMPWWPSDTRDTCQQSLIQILAIGTSERLDLALLVRNLATEHRWSYRRRLQRLAQRLSEGTNLVEALEQTPDVLTDNAVLTIRVATQNGTLPITLNRLAERNDESRNRRQTHIRQIWIYGSMIALVVSLILLFLFTSIVPILVNLADEISPKEEIVAFPWEFQLLISFGRMFINFGPWLAMAFLIGVIVTFSPVSRWLRRTLASWFPANIASPRNAELLNMLADNAEAGRPMPGALSTLARYHFEPKMRQQLLLARNEVEQGTELWTSMAEARLLTSAEAAALDRLTSSSSIAWTLRRLSLWKRGQFDRRCDKRLALVHPILIIIVASVVVLVCLGFFQFLVQLTYSVSNPISR